MKTIKIRDTRGNETTALRIDPKEHQRQYEREYRKRPHVIARRKTPEALAQKAAYDKEHVKEYQNRAEIKEGRRKYRKEYNQRPEVKEHRREVRKRHLLKKFENDTKSTKGVRKNA